MINIYPDINFNGLTYVAQRKYINADNRRLLLNISNAITSIFPSIDQENLSKILHFVDIYNDEESNLIVFIGPDRYYLDFSSIETLSGRYMAELVITLVSFYIYRIHLHDFYRKEDKICS